MRINFIHRFLAFIFLALILSTSIHSDEIEVGQSIKWKAVPGASGYKLDLEDDKGNAILSRNIETNSLQLELGVGKYRFRISVINKFKKIGRVYDWQQLVVKPIDSPKVKESPTVFNPKDSKKDFLVKGDNLYQRTAVTLKSKDNKYIKAKVEVLPDGTGIRVIVPDNLPDGDYSIVFKNVVGKPAERSVAIDSYRPTQMKVVEDRQSIFGLSDSSDTTSSSDSREPQTKGSKMWSMFWRQALIPGWGHYYAGHKKTGAFYFIGAVAGTAHFQTEFHKSKVRRNNYENSGNLITYLNLNGSTDIALEAASQFSLQNNFDKAEKSRARTTQAGNGLLAFYLISLVHVVITGASEESDQTFFIESIPEFWLNEVGTKYSAGYTKRF